MRVLLATAAVVGCSRPQHPPVGEHVASAPTIAPDARTPDAADARPLTFAVRSIPNVLRLPVRADIEPTRVPNINSIEFLRPLCITANGAPVCRVRPDFVVAADSAGSFHGEGVGVLSVSMTYSNKLSVSLDRWDASTSLADAAEFSEGMATLEDDCVKIPWSSDGVGTLKAVRGAITRADASGLWMFEPRPRLCAADHRPGDDHVFDAPLPATGSAMTKLPARGYPEVYLTGTLRPGPQVVADSFYRMEWHRP